jgi:hypothetical protein
MRPTRTTLTLLLAVIMIFAALPAIAGAAEEEFIPGVTDFPSRLGEPKFIPGYTDFPSRLGTKEPIRVTQVPQRRPVATAADGGFSWRDAGVGALASLGLVLLAGGALRLRGRMGAQAPPVSPTPSP